MMIFPTVTNRWNRLNLKNKHNGPSFLFVLGEGGIVMMKQKTWTTNTMRARVVVFLHFVFVMRTISDGWKFKTVTILSLALSCFLSFWALFCWSLKFNEARREIYWSPSFPLWIFILPQTVPSIHLFYFWPSRHAGTSPVRAYTYWKNDWSFIIGCNGHENFMLLLWYYVWVVV